MIILVGINLGWVPLVETFMGTVFLTGRASKFKPLESSSGSLSVTSSKSESWADKHSKEEFKLLFDEMVWSRSGVVSL